MIVYETSWISDYFPLGIIPSSEIVEPKDIHIFKAFNIHY